MGHSITGKRKNRFWSDDEKRSICQQALVPGISVALVARRYAMNWVGKSTALLEPLADAIGRIARRGEAIFAPLR